MRSLASSRKYCVELTAKSEIRRFFKLILNLKKYVNTTFYFLLLFHQNFNISTKKKKNKIRTVKKE